MRSTLLAFALYLLFAGAGYANAAEPAQTQTPAQTPAPTQSSAATKQPAPPAWLDSAYEFSPEGCEFAIKFPEKPYQSRRCDPVEPTRNCNTITSYTKVFGMSAAVDFNVTCYPADAGMYERYSDAVMQTTLLAMAKPLKLESFDTGYNEYKTAKMAVLLGGGKTETQQEMIYTAQLWIGQKSVFTLEAQLRGAHNEDSDRLFAEILRTARLKDDAAPVATGESKAESEPQAEAGKAAQKPTRH